VLPLETACAVDIYCECMLLRMTSTCTEVQHEWHHVESNHMVTFSLHFVLLQAGVGTLCQSDACVSCCIASIPRGDLTYESDIISN
jgi:hypothetical protein